MADVINLSDHRRKPPPSLEQVIAAGVEQVSLDWERFAKLNRLNDYFTDAAGAWTEDGVSYLSDLNALSKIEDTLGMNIMVASPYGEHIGWRASFPLRSRAVCTPDMPFEAYARCFNILLFLKLKRDLLASGLADEL